MIKICIMTATRAEYGLLSPLIKKLIIDQQFEVRIVVTGMHLSSEFGLTYREIEKDGIHIDKKIEILLSADTPAAITKSMGLALIGFADYFAETNPDALLVLGDRYEALAVCIAAMNARIPIVHVHGGETTEGCIDEAIRHCITKMSYLHFTSTEEYRRRVIQLGEDPSRVFKVGALGTENVITTELMSKEHLENSLGIDLSDGYALGTFHPVTLEEATADKQVQELLNALDRNSDITYIFTKANADQNGRMINDLLERYAYKHKNFFLFDSLGKTKYLSAVKYASFVIGNSSSGLIEVPSFHIPTIDVGDRQKGRIAGESVIRCSVNCDDIDKAIKKARDEKFRSEIVKIKNPYGEGETSRLIINILKNEFCKKQIDIKKQFYDLKDNLNIL